MKTSVDEFTSILVRINERLEQLESRLSVLEQRLGVLTPHAERSTQHAATTQPALPKLPSPGSGVALATIGRVFLGLAGAYVLRALSESGVLPHMAVVFVALAYAFAWLVWAVVGRAQTSFARVACAITSSLILSPMLWELSTRFGLLAPPLTAGILAAFVILTAALAWKPNLSAVMGVVTFAVASTCLVLLVATRDPAPFVLSLVSIALIQEWIACRDRWLGWRPIAAAALDFAILALILIYTRPDLSYSEYRPIQSLFLLTLVATPFAIYGTSTIFRTIVLQRRISVFEIGQALAAFLLACIGALRLNSSAGPVLGVICLLGAAAFYMTAFKSLSEGRNYHVFATWAAALFLAGSFFLVPDTLRTTLLDLAALAGIFAAIRSSRMTVGFHGATYLAAAAVSSSLFSSSAYVLAGAPPFLSSWLHWLTAATAVLGYVLATRGFSGQAWRQRVLRLAFAGQAAYILPALTVILLLWLSRTHELSDPLLAFLRTISVCLIALALAFIGARWQRVELVWLAYVAIAFCTLKLLFEDLPHGTAGSIAASLFCYGMVWVLVARVTRRPAAV